MFKQVEIPLSKSKLVLILLGSLAFVAIGFWLISSFITEPLGRHNHILSMLAGFASCIFFGFIAIFLIIKLFKNERIGLIINEQGIFDNSSGVASGQILWEDLLEIEVLEVGRQKFIALFVKNPEDYIKRQTNLITRKGMGMNYKMYGTPIQLGANTLTCNFETLKELVERGFKNYKISGNK
ncbi:MAG: STM3941 family protein [Bacteroidota bacterium]